MNILRIFQLISLLIGIIAFVTGKDYIGDVNSSDMGEVLAFIFSVLWAVIKLFITYIVLTLSLASSFLVFLVDLIIDGNLLNTMWTWSWSEVTVNWFWQQTEGIKLFFAFLMSSTIGFFFDKE